MKKKILFDDLFFTFANTGIARVWRSLFEVKDFTSRLSESNLEIVILNRSGKLVDLPFSHVDFPKLDMSKPSLDRLSLDKVVEYLEVDLFVSSYYTFSHLCENLFVAYDMIPEKFSFENLNSVWNERQVGILCSENFLTISHSTKNDLRELYPWIKEEKISVAYPAINHEIFVRPDDTRISLFAKEHALAKYFVFVGSRAAEYKNSKLIFELLSAKSFEESFVFVGGDPFSPAEIASIGDNHVLHLKLDDDELATCLAGAESLVYPSLYEGFGIPPLEALAVGTPVITTGKASLPEVVGDLSLRITGDSVEELREALFYSMTPEWKRHIRHQGPIWSSKFSWEEFADGFISACLQALNQPQTDSEFKKLTLEFTEKSSLMLI